MTVDQTLVRRRTTEIDISETPVGQFRPLDIYSEATDYRESVSRYEAIATISLGYTGKSKDGRPIPRASRQDDDRQIHLHDGTGRADGLRKRLEEGKYRKLMVAFPFDDPNLFVQQRFTYYTQTALKLHGDEHGLTEIVNTPVKRQRTNTRTGEITTVDEVESVHHFHAAGTDRFKELVKHCKVATSIYFYLAAWDADGFKVEFPDGMGYYRIRTTSRNSVRTLLAEIREVAKRTHGQIAGIPFELGVDHREVAGPDGSKRTIPVWTAVFKGPPNAVLSSRTFVLTAQDGIEQARMLSLPAPAQETLDDLERGYAEGEFTEAEGDVIPGEIVEPTDEELARVNSGGLCDPVHWGRLFHLEVKDSRYATDEGRADLLLELTDFQTSSLAEHLRTLNEDQATRFYLRVRAAVMRAKNEDEPDRAERLAAEANNLLYGEEEPDPQPVNWPRETAPEDPVLEAALAPAPAPPVVSADFREVPAEPAPAAEQKYGPDPWDRDEAEPEQPTLFAGEAAPAEAPASDAPDTGAADALFVELCQKVAAATSAKALDELAGRVKLADMGHELELDHIVDLGQRIDDARTRLPQPRTAAKA